MHRPGRRFTTLAAVVVLVWFICVPHAAAADNEAFVPPKVKRTSFDTNDEPRVRSKPDALKKLLDDGLSPDATGPGWRTLLWYAIRDKKHATEKVALLLKYGADPNLPTRPGASVRWPGRRKPPGAITASRSSSCSARRCAAARYPTR